MTAVRAFVVFCEDIRDEVDNRHSIVGTLPDNVFVQEYPSMFPKFCMFIRVDFPVDKRPVDLRFITTETNGENHEVGMISVDILKQAQGLARQHNRTLAGVVSIVRAMPYGLDRPGKLLLHMHGLKSPVEIGSIDFLGPKVIN